MSLDLLADLLIGFGLVCLLGCVGAYRWFNPRGVRRRQERLPELPVSAQELALREFVVERKRRRE
jgi:hypothetical protein